MKTHSPILLLQLLRNMGLRYVAFRIWYLFQKKTGLLRIRFPKFIGQSGFITLDEWRNLHVNFLQKDDKQLRLLSTEAALDSLTTRVANIHSNKFTFFSSAIYMMADWHTNPETGFTYSKHQHWSEIPDFSSEAGDIKYVWEKSRFTFFYDLLRFDFHFKKDQSKVVFAQIQSWIDANPVNCGPNWKCSQEITLRVLNWTFALHYYKNSPALTKPIFEQIMDSIYRQMQHVASNIHFSKIAVRNNHAITETLGLYLIGLLYPFFPKSERWKKKGQKWFEEEIAYQIYSDGTFLQFSMNYHRVVIQLLTWAIGLAELNGEQWSDTVYDRAKKSLQFLSACQDTKTGWLPNYGNNDGALFFPLTDCHFRDFRPQLGALANLLKMDLGYKAGIWEEETLWLGQIGINRKQIFKESNVQFPLPLIFPKGGYYISRETETITFLRCGSYKDRPFQADNLHLDIWVNGENILRDAGSYRYNADEKWSKYFMGSASHNTVMLDDSDQMHKGAGFIWFNWIKRAEATLEMKNIVKHAVFEGQFEGFRTLGIGIIHRRKVRKKIDRLYWEIEDWIENAPKGVVMNQLWHPSKIFFEAYTMEAFDVDGEKISCSESSGWHSDFYGQKVEGSQVTFSTNMRYIRTIIEMKTV